MEKTSKQQKKIKKYLTRIKLITTFTISNNRNASEDNKRSKQLSINKHFKNK